MGFEIEGKAALVTGANRGIGKAIVEALLERRTSSLISAPQPGPSGRKMWPSFTTGGFVTSSAFHATSSMSISMMRTLGSTAQRWREWRSARCL